MAKDGQSLRRTDVSPGHTVRLRVARAHADDIGTATARLGLEPFRRLGLSVGDVIELAGKRRTAVVALRLHFEDRGLDVVRIEGLVRANAGAGIGDYVDVRRVAVADARRMTLATTDSLATESAWLERGSLAPDALGAIHRAVLKRVVTTGDLISVPCPRRTLGDLSPIEAHRGDPALATTEIQLRVAATEPDGSVRVSSTTEIDLRDERVVATRPQRSGVTYDDVGGLADVIARLRETVELPLARPDLFFRLGVAPSRGVLLHGPSGSGKTLLARAVAGETGARLLVVDSASIRTADQGIGAERTLAAVFQQAREQAPAIILIDDVDTIAPARDAGGHERRLVAQLHAHIDEIGYERDIVLIGTTSRLEAVDDGLRRPGRFDHEISVGPIDRAGRREVLAIHGRHLPLASDVDLGGIADAALGFTGADVAALVREAAGATVRRALAAGTPAQGRLALAAPLEVTHRDFENALTRIRPSTLRELAVDVPSVRWCDIGGLGDVKRALRDGIELPLKHAEAFARLGIRASKGFLLFGPPGTGKTMLARAVAREAGANFIAVKPSDVLSKWFGDSERQIAQLFARARRVAPTILFFDEIEALIPRRGDGAGEPAASERVVNAILMELDGLEELRGVIVIGATNQPALVDRALLRPGRIDELIYVRAPNGAERLHILRVLTARMPLSTDVDLVAVAGRTIGYTGADLEGLVRRAGFRAFCENADACEVRIAHFDTALGDSRGSVTPEIEREYEAVAETLGLGRAIWRGAIGFIRPHADPDEPL